ncbi:MAG: heme lyase CcmF/NrfE family subunit [Candidatus Eisenbacteria bacterium]|nr:heme lyase CcmF/NrfE family subunit [Candidatus Eisenbacteria bacterium]MCC7143083.1 heme lyase CcmF/NrfE family subunit [Candidatus Eisenbacteria bacterium]
MIQLGYYTTTAAFFIALLGIGLAIFASAKKRNDAYEAARNAVVACAFFTTIGAVAVVYAMLVGDYQLEYVWAHSDRDMPLLYKIGALWGGQAGSLLFWGFLLAVYSSIAVMRHRKDRLELMAPAIATMLVVIAFFLGTVTFASSPWDRASFIPPDGRGLNPLLQHPAMVIHPPCLYLGFVGFTLPFAFAMGALVSGRTDAEWLKKSRVWSIIAWTFLGAGNILGGRWAYVELGWGGYWAWDPVENAAFMPWLAGTAFIHSAMIQERKGMLKIWNMVLVTITFLLTIFGTFITRSGLISSVHSFAQSSIGYYFAGFLIFLMIAAFGLILMRRKELSSAQQLDSFFSRESSFLLNNLILLGGCFAVLWGTIFPMISEAAQGVRISVGPPFFNQIMIPIGLALLLLMGVGPLVPWRRSSIAGLKKLFSIPVVLALIAGALLLLLGVSHAYALVTFSICAFVLVTIVTEFARGIRARQSSSGTGVLRSLFDLFAKGQRRYGGYVIHLGVVIIFVGFAGAAFTRDGEGTLRRGESLEFHGYTLTFRELLQNKLPGVDEVSAEVMVSKGQTPLAFLYPQKNFFKKSEQLASEVAIHSTWGYDLYLVLGDYADDGGSASFKVYVNPLVRYFWFGGIVMVFGGLLVLWPMPRRGALAT